MLFVVAFYISLHHDLHLTMSTCFTYCVAGVFLCPQKVLAQRIRVGVWCYLAASAVVLLRVEVVRYSRAALRIRGAVGDVGYID